MSIRTLTPEEIDKAITNKSVRSWIKINEADVTWYDRSTIIMYKIAQSNFLSPAMKISLKK